MGAFLKGHVKPRPPSEYTDFYQSSDYARFPQQHRSGGTGLSLMSVVQKSHDFIDPPVPELVIAAARRTDMEFRWHIGDGWTPMRSVRSGSLHILPPDTEAQIDARGMQDMLFASVNTQLLDPLLRDCRLSVDSIASANTDYFWDPVMVQTLERIWNLSASQCPSSTLEVDGLFLTLVAGFAKRTGKPVAHSVHALSKRQMSQIAELIEDRLVHGIRIADLAEAVGLDRFSFSRQFKNAFGCTPQNYVMERRVARACELLESKQFGELASVAYAVGFSSQAHMTTVMKQRLGVTPAKYQKNVARK